ncbi:type I restriction enzyme M protein [Salinibacter ruber]|jgi:type I restriction enzyme M protein|uniref:type I restriction-modification system subunit M n=1 Tax=Salinibacter ruber TaxID=146919 RepID=UPI00216835BC|nr:class I SAM-dependent DNA methyltransferase [Salinibacter ruber]MCS3666425.1 type I restriction enzyme M protein [Salinibacter ruber]
MITGSIRKQVDKLWTTFWNNGISNPLTVIEQISYLLFLKRLDDLHTARKKRANRLDEPIKDPIFGEDEQHLRWRNFRHRDPEEMFEIVSQEAFPFIKELHGDPGADGASSYANHMQDAVFLIPNANLLSSAVEQIDELPIQDRDTKGDLYEYMLSKLNTAGQNGQFRTPRHIIEMMVEMVEPDPDDVVCDPACGTGGFLIGVGEYLRDEHPEMLRDDDQRRYFEHEMFTGYDFDSTMLRIGSMNMMLHGIEHATIERRDSLASGGVNDRAEEDEYTLVLANPPFKGSLDEERVDPALLKVVDTKKTELLFVAQILRSLQPGGRAAMIVPDGVLFGSSNAHTELREHLVENHRLRGVVSMPSGVFKPYAGVSTGVLIFTKTGSGGTEDVWFYDMEADGFSLDDKREEIDANDIPDILDRWDAWTGDGDKESQRPRTAKSFAVPKAEIADNDYDLSINRYKEAEYETAEHEDPTAILGDLKTMEADIQRDMNELETMLSG